MKSLLLLSLAGAAIYAALVFTANPDSNSGTVAVQPKSGQLSSWASDLRSLKPQVVSQKRPPTPYYERKPRQKFRTIDDSPAAESALEAKPALAASPQPKTVKAASRKAEHAGSARTAATETAVIKQPEYRRGRWQRRAERRARKAFHNRAFLLGR